MIAKRFRFHGYGSFRFVYSKGKTVRARFLSLKYIQNTRRDESRLAIVVSKKITKKAPERNRIRRLLYEAFRQQWAMVVPGYDLVVTVFDQRVGTMSHEEVAKAVDELLAQSQLYKRD